MWRFFLQVRVRVEHIAIAFPDIAQTVQGAADGIVRKARAAGTFEIVLQEWHGPSDRQMTKLMRWHDNRISQKRLGLAGPARRTTGARSITETCQIRAGRIARDPVIHALPTNLQQAGDLGHAGATSPHQQREDASIESDIINLAQLVFELLHLRWREPFIAHGRVLLGRRIPRTVSVSNYFCGLA